MGEPPSGARCGDGVVGGHRACTSTCHIDPMLRPGKALRTGHRNRYPTSCSCRPARLALTVRVAAGLCAGEAQGVRTTAPETNQWTRAAARRTPALAASRDWGTVALRAPWLEVCPSHRARVVASTGADRVTGRRCGDRGGGLVAGVLDLAAHRTEPGLGVVRLDDSVRCRLHRLDGLAVRAHRV